MAIHDLYLEESDTKNIMLDGSEKTITSELESEHDPLQLPSGLVFPSDEVHSVEGNNTTKPHIDFRIQQYDGSQFVSEGGGWGPQSGPQLRQIQTEFNAAVRKGSSAAQGPVRMVRDPNSDNFVSYVPERTLQQSAIQGATEGFLYSLGAGIGLGEALTRAAPSFVSTTEKKAPGPGTTSSGPHIRLFMPHQIQEQFAPIWSDEDIGLSGAIALGGVPVLEELKNHLGPEFKRVVGGIAGTAMGNPALANVLLRQDGMALNNHLEAFFKGVGFRRFSYTFQMNPKSKAESEAIQQIVKAFKYASAPELATSGQYYGRFFKYPNQFKISYWNGEQTHKLSPCVLDSLSVNYGSGQSNMTFKNKFPLQVDLSLNFKEIQIMHKAEFEDGK